MLIEGVKNINVQGSDLTFLKEILSLLKLKCNVVQYVNLQYVFNIHIVECRFHFGVYFYLQISQCLYSLQIYRYVHIPALSGRRKLNMENHCTFYVDFQES